MRNRIELGDEVQDAVSGFRGIVTSVHVYLHGCVRLTVTTKATKSNDTKDKTFDEPQLKVIKKKRVSEGSRFTGGTDKYVDEGR